MSRLKESFSSNWNVRKPEIFIYAFAFDYYFHNSDLILNSNEFLWPSRTLQPPVVSFNFGHMIS